MFKSFWLDCKQNKVFCLFICLFCILALTVGLNDNDFYWQTEIGKNIVHNFDFYSYYNQLWGDRGIGIYYDHEWLYNTILYLIGSASLQPELACKFIICVLTALFLLYFLHYFDKLGMSDVKKLLFLGVFLVYCMSSLNVKAYSVATLFVLVEIILMDKYKRTQDWKLFFIVVLLCILWNNMHSGSVVVFFMIAGFYWLFSFRDVKTLLFGVACICSLLINPYGYKLITFDLLHGTNKLMFKINADWNSIDAKTANGLVTALVVLLGFYCLINTAKLTREYVAFMLVGSLMVMMSRRHFSFVFVFIILALINCDVDIDFNRLRKIPFYLYVVPLFLIVFSYLMYITQDSIYKDVYKYNNLVSEDFRNKVVETVKVSSADGLYANGYSILFFDEGVKNFSNGIFPLCEDRCLVVDMMENGGTFEILNDIIEQYGFDKFIVNKSFRWDEKLKEEVRGSLIYRYLSDNDDYVLVCKSDNYSYFVSKDIYNKAMKEGIL